MIGVSAHSRRRHEDARGLRWAGPHPRTPELHPALPSDGRRQEIADRRCDFVAVRLESEVSGLEERDLRILDVTLEGQSTCGHEERVSVAPDGQQRRLMLAKVLLELRIHLDIARVVEE